MPDTITFYFDFASPYGYFASTRIDALAAEFGLKTHWKPVLLWALFQKAGIAVPMEAPIRREYLLRDIERSAEFYNVPYKLPPKFGAISTHSAARLYYHVAKNDPDRAKEIGRRIFKAYIENARDISDKYVIEEIAIEAGLAETEIAAASTDDIARRKLETAIEDALNDGVVGSPFFIVNGEGFFGVDRLPQLKWYLAERRK